MRQYIGFSRDHSGSMNSISQNALDDYNTFLNNAKEAAQKYGIETYVSTVACMVTLRGNNILEVSRTPIHLIDPISVYPCNGGTPLFDSVMDLIADFEKLPDEIKNDKDTAFLLVVVTDGEENVSKTNAALLKAKINQLTATGRWTITFRVPKGYARALNQLGISLENILEVDYGNVKEITGSTIQTAAATNNFFEARTRGFTASTNFYAGTASLAPQAVENQLADITNQVRVIPVAAEEQISSLATRVTGSYIRGTAYYQLVKKETVQANKQFIIRDKQSGKCYSGASARQLLSLPTGGSIELNPGATPRYDIFIQSTSSNRKLLPNTSLIVWT